MTLRKGAFSLTFVSLCLIIPASLLAGIPGAGGFKVIFEADSVYHHIVVAEDTSARYLRFDRSFQSGMHLNDPYESPFLYAAYAHLGLIFRPQAKRVLMVGLGGGSIQKRFRRDYPEITIDVAELDPMVVEVAKRFFAVKEDTRLQITIQDGRLFLRRAQQRYDIIILDAYFADSIPFHLATTEFVQLAKSRLEPGGIIVSNIIGALDGPRSSLFRAMYKTFGTAFPGLYSFPTAYRPYLDPEIIRNIVLVATNEHGLTRGEIIVKARQLAPRVTYAEFPKFAGDYYDLPIPTGDVPMLTDDYAPVDTLLSVWNWTPPKP